ncbi:hypothetical protein GEMRC1_011687 [Eukaryota sp. GEM-RC1]
MSTIFWCHFIWKQLLGIVVVQLLWAAQGASDTRPGKRIVCSAGAVYPLQLIVIIQSVESLIPGVYRYSSSSHTLSLIKEGLFNHSLQEAALDQSFVSQAPAVVLFAADYTDICQKYKQRGINYTFIEVGHAAQNLALQAVSLGLGSVDVGAFHDDDVKNLLGLNPGEHPVLLVPIGTAQ